MSLFLSTIPHFLISVSYNVKDAVVFAYSAGFVVNRYTGGHSEKGKERPGVGGTNKNKKADKAGSKIDGSAAGITDSAEAVD